MSLRNTLFGIPGNFGEFKAEVKDESSKEIELEIYADVYLAEENSLDSILCPRGHLNVRAKKENGRPIKLKIKPKIEEEEWQIKGDIVGGYLRFFDVLKDKAERYEQELKELGVLSVKENNNIPHELKKYAHGSQFSYIPNEDTVSEIDQIENSTN